MVAQMSQFSILMLLIKRAIESIPLLYVAMFWPGWILITDLFAKSWYYPQMMHESGNLSIWFLIATLSVTPALIVINRLKFGVVLGRWLLRRRKHFGIASSLYATVHTLHYIRYIGDFTAIWVEGLEFDFLVGWLGLFVLLALAVTSNRASTRRLGRSWKTLHRLIYPGTILIWLHWYLFEFFTAEVFIWGAILALVKGVQFGLRRRLDAVRSRRSPFPT